MSERGRSARPSQDAPRPGGTARQEPAAAQLAAACLDAVLEALGRPALVLDGKGRLARANRAGRALLRGGGRALLDELRERTARASGQFELVPLGDDGDGGGVLVIARSRLPALESRLAEARRQWGLSDRQHAVLSLVAQGASNAAIAQSLGVSVKTVELRVTQLLERSRTDCRAALVAEVWAGEGRRC